MANLTLDSIRNGLPTLTEDMGRFLSEAALHCFRHREHVSGVRMEILQRPNDEIHVVWSFDLDERSEYTYGDPEEATEYGATCVAILLSLLLTGHKTVERSWKGNGFDYWLGPFNHSHDPPFQHAARLEISGILHGSRSQLRARSRSKARQTMVSDQSGLPAIISVIEFSAPAGTFEERWPT